MIHTNQIPHKQKGIDRYIGRYIDLLAYIIPGQLGVKTEVVHSSLLPVMSNEIPHFRYNRINLRNKQFGCIMLHEDVIHRIGLMDEFFKEFGYTQEPAKNGILPEEFIWETFFRYPNRNCDACYQLHMIKYLLEHSDTFARKYGHECDDWIAAHAEARAACKLECVDKKGTSKNYTSTSSMRTASIVNQRVIRSC